MHMWITSPEPSENPATCGLKADRISPRSDVCINAGNRRRALQPGAARLGPRRGCRHKRHRVAYGTLSYAAEPIHDGRHVGGYRSSIIASGKCAAFQLGGGRAHAREVAVGEGALQPV